MQSADQLYKLYKLYKVYKLYKLYKLYKSFISGNCFCEMFASYCSDELTPETSPTTLNTPCIFHKSLQPL